MERTARMWLGAGIAVAVAVAVCVLWGNAPAPAVPGSGSPRDAAGAGAASAATGTAPPTAQASSAVREEVKSPAIEGSVAFLRGRCVAAEDGRPLAGCVVKLEGKIDQEMTTAADGVFAFTSSAREQFDVAITAKGRAPRRGTWLKPIAAGQTEDLGDVRLQRGFTVRGRVVDPEGRGVAGVALLVFGSDASLRAGEHATGGSDGKTGDDGAFTLSPDLPPGENRLMLLNRKMRGDGVFHIDAFTGVEPLVVVVEPDDGASIRGVVVDDVGAPVAEAMLKTARGEAHALTAADGKFVFADAGVKLTETAVVVEAPGRCDADPTPHVTHWGEHDLRIVLRRAKTLTVEVVDDGGAPVREFGVWVGSEPNLVMGEQFSRVHGAHEDGRAVVDPVRRGHNLLRVFPHAPELLASEAQAVEVGDGEVPPVRIVLERLRACEVEVVDAGGAPVAGAKIKLLRMRGDLHDSLDNVRVVRGVTDWYRRSRTPELIADAVSAGDGRAALFAPRAMPGMLLRVDCERFVPFHQVDPALSPDRSLRVVLAAPGAIAGTVALHGQPRTLFQIQLDGPDGKRIRLGGFAGLAPLPDGSFAVERLAAGQYVARVARVMTWNVPGSSRTSWVPLATSERRVTIEAGKTTAVELDAPVPAFAALHGRLTVDGGAATAGWHVDLVYMDGIGASRGAFTVGADGSFTADELLPGRYRVKVNPQSPDSNTPSGLLAEVVDVAPGSDLTREFTFTPRRLVLHLRHPDGAAVSQPWEFRCGARTGWVGNGSEYVLDPAPELPVEIRLRGDDNAWSEPISMPQDRREFTADVIVPAAAR